MVPLESEPTEIRPSSSGGGSTDASPSAPIAVLSKAAFKDAVLELEATVRRTRDRSSVAAHQAWHSAERRLGLEVEISDPAIKELFGLHVLSVEVLCGQVRTQAEAALAAADMFGQPALGSTVAGFRALGDIPVADGASVALESELRDAERTATIARKRLESRIREEVFEPLEEQLQAHAQVREDIRERQRWYNVAERLRRDVTYLKRGASGSGLRDLSGRSSSGPQEEADLRLREALDKVSELDSRILARLLELGEESVDVVRKPWGALLQIEAEYFMAQQAMWVPLATAFDECVEPGKTQ